MSAWNRWYIAVMFGLIVASQAGVKFTWTGIIAGAIIAIVVYLALEGDKTRRKEQK
ncbi:hypothetical protein [Arthrobacter rhombi]|uniref:hypothetical protein n=1 Tax=Arthrobacter rhombi TaxID=71253 RepID=UPI003FD27B8F